MKHITYQEAADLLGVALTTVQHAIGHELTKVPTASTRGLLVKEQVELFKGKGGRKKLSFNSLNEQERRLWQQYHDTIVAPARPLTPANSPAPIENTQAMMYQLGQQLASPEALAALGTAMGVALIAALKNNGEVPQGVPFSASIK